MKTGKSVPDFMINATNVYRTPEYIVRQQITIVASPGKDSYLLSEDTYFERTPLREFQYICVFANRRRVDGRRLPSTAYTRKYVS